MGSGSVEWWVGLVHRSRAGGRSSYNRSDQVDSGVTKVTCPIVSGFKDHHVIRGGGALGY